MSPVSVVVVCRPTPVDEIDEPVDALSAAARQIVMPGSDARIDDRHADTRAIEPE